MLTVGDARGEVRLDTNRVRAFVLGDYVFVFYWRLYMREPGPSWSLAERGSRDDADETPTFGGLVIFNRSHAIPEPRQ